ncbi:Transposase and inactivated derivatives, IS30 family [Kytococcus sedentarius]|nr:Transposase and inactivated derivatives, IS30 family [Kytococcus sedentarius]
MNALGLAGVPNTRTPKTTRRPTQAVEFPDDQLERDFSAPAPDTRWVADIPPQAGGAPTYVSTWSGFVYVAFVTDLSRWSAEDLAAVAYTLNNRPRKVLGWKTPAEVLDEHLRSIPRSSVATTG